MKNIFSELGYFLRKFRQMHGIDADEMAKAFGCSRQYMYGLETGTRNPSEKYFENFCKFYGIEDGEEKDTIRQIFNLGRRSVKIELTGRDNSTKALITEFSDKIDKLDENKKIQILNILRSK